MFFQVKHILNSIFVCYQLTASEFIVLISIDMPEFFQETLMGTRYGILDQSTAKSSYLPSEILAHSVLNIHRY